MDVVYEQFRNKYIDEDRIFILLQPYLKSRKLEAPAIAAGILAILLEGLIIFLGTGGKNPRNNEEG